MKKKLIYALVLLALFIACCLPHIGENQPKTTADGMLTAHFIDVGQGDSELLQLPDGQTMLIDAGGDVRNYIASLGIEKIDYLVATHPHADHIAYMEEVIRDFDIGEVYMPRVSHTSKTFENMLLAIQEKGLKIKTAKAGVNILSADGLTIDIVAPASDSYDDLNNYSAVIQVTYKDTAMLFTGDAETLSENQIAADISADVLKVGHHGSSTSSSASFLNRVNPKIAVISCGEGNDYGHPHREVLQRLNKRNVEIYRTDEDGTIVITSDGMNLEVSTSK